MIEHEGPGWRLAWDPSKLIFSFLVGGTHWAFELSENEWLTLAPLIFDLIAQYEDLRTQLMPEESFSIELEKKPWWVCIDGKNETWSLKLILIGESQDGRSMEMYWPEPIGPVVTSSMRTMWDSYQKNKNVKMNL